MNNLASYEIKKYHGSFNRSYRGNTSIKYIVMHYTGAGSSAPGCARNNCIYFSGGDRQASADYFVDDADIYEYNDPSSGYYTWHCGDGYGVYGITNSNSIGIEVCMNGDNPYTAAEIDRATFLVQYLMNRFGIPANNIVRHYDASRKLCPYYYANRQDAWNNLKAQLTGGAVSGDSSNSNGGFTDPTGLSLTEVAQRVINGEFGNGDERKQRLIAAGYDYNAVQTEVNRLLGGGSANTGSPSSNGITAGTYRIIVDSLNVRTAPSTSAQSVASYSAGESVILDGWSTTANGYIWGRYVGASSGQYRYIAIKEINGSDYAVLNGTTGSGGNNGVSTSVPAGRYQVIVDTLNVRTAPTTSAQVATYYNNGGTVNLDGYSTVADGYVWGRYIGATSGQYRYIAIRTTGGTEYAQKI